MTQTVNISLLKSHNNIMKVVINEDIKKMGLFDMSKFKHDFMLEKAFLKFISGLDRIIINMDESPKPIKTTDINIYGIATVNSKPIHSYSLVE